MSFASRPDRPPDYEHDGIQVWIDEQKGSLFVIVRKDHPDSNKRRLVETHSGQHGGEFRFERIPE
jgi:hypothetical protein